MKTAKHAQLHGILRDFIKSEQRIRDATQGTDYRGLFLDYLKMLAVLLGCGFAGWLLWQISGGLVGRVL